MSIGRVPGATGIQPSIVDAKGDIIAATAADSVSRLAVGTNNQVLTADSAEATGLKYANEARATLTTTGDILYASAANTPARLGIGSTDQVLKVSGGVPVWGAPTFIGCSLYDAVTKSITNATFNLLTFPSEQFDTNGFHSTTTNTSRITIPTGLGGYYLVSGNLRFAANGTGSRVLMLRKNGSDLLTITEYAGTASATATGRGTLIWNFAAGDYLEVLAYQSSGGNLTLYAREEETPFQVQFLGA